MILMQTRIHVFSRILTEETPLVHLHLYIASGVFKAALCDGPLKTFWRLNVVSKGA